MPCGIPDASTEPVTVPVPSAFTVTQTNYADGTITPLPLPPSDKMAV